MFKFLKESKKEASDEREGVQLVKILEGIPGERTKVNMNIQDSAWTKRQKNHHPIYIEKPSIKDYLLTFSIFVGCTVIGLVFRNFISQISILLQCIFLACWSHLL